MEHARRIFECLHERMPSPECELVHEDAFTLLIAVVLSARATDVSVNKATPALFEKARTPARMLQLGVDRLTPYIQTIGLYRTKAQHIIGLCRMLVEHYDSKVPQTREELMSLPGVGRKTANVVLSVAWGQPTVAVDTHVFRVARRLGLTQGQTPEQVERDLEATIPKIYLQKAHHWLILHGRYVCKATKPKCDQCVLRSICPACSL